MDSSGHDAGGERRQGSNPLANGDAAGDLTVILSRLDARLDHLDRTATAFDQRLQAIEAHLHIAAPPNVARVATPTATARDLPTAPPSVDVAPQLEPTPDRSDTGNILAAAQALLEEQPFSRRRQPARSPGVLKPSPEPSAPEPAPLPHSRTRPSVSLDDLERAVSGRGLAWVGGLTLLLGTLFFLSLAISRGWIGPEARVVIGLVAGIVVTALGDRLMRGGDRVLGPVLVAVGIGIWNLALVAGTRLYDFIPLWAALLGTSAGALVATAIAIRANAQVIALYGVVTALAAPILFDVPAARTPMAYLTIVLAGSTAIALARGWAWLPPVAFVLSEIQFFAWWLPQVWPNGRRCSPSQASRSCTSLRRPGSKCGRVPDALA
jgi:uncharacterized membrane protein